jgi:hypothetical protein
LLHNVVHIAVGVWGLAAGRAYASAVAYCKLLGFVYLALAALGFVIPAGFGLIPIGGNDIWLHCFLGVVLIAFGFMAADEATTAAPLSA